MNKKFWIKNIGIVEAMPEYVVRESGIYFQFRIIHQKEMYVFRRLDQLANIREF